jgi:hypothetical protein
MSQGRVLDEKNKALEEEIRRLRAERLRLERDTTRDPPSEIEKSFRSANGRLGVTYQTIQEPCQRFVYFPGGSDSRNSKGRGKLAPAYTH